MIRWCLPAVTIGLLACGGGPSSPAQPGPQTTPTLPAGPYAVVLAAGDIGWCGVPAPEATAKLLDANPAGQVLALGDLAYPGGAAADFQNCYEPNWGRHKSRTKPVPGNHDYLTASGAAYYAYFGGAAGTPGHGYYSYSLETWHIVALNSNIDMSASSAQLAWLEDDLRANPSACTLAYWHFPLFTSGPSQGVASTRTAWRVLYAAGVDVLITGHDHLYERLAPQTPDGAFDAVNGIRAFVVGTGGAPLYNILRVAANSEVRSRTHGVLRLTLRPGGYDWEFIPIAGETFRDSGSATCH